MTEMLPKDLETAVFGKQVDLFWDSEIGQYLLGHALREYNTSLETLKSCDPSDSKTVARLQGEIWRAESFRDWLSRAIEDGIRATNILEGIDDAL